AGLLKETEEPRVTPPPAPHRFQSRTWPDYARCLRDAPARNRGEGKDTSRAAFQVALIAADRGFTAEEISEELLNVRGKAKKVGQRYADRTAQRAARSVSKNKT